MQWIGDDVLGDDVLGDADPRRGREGLTSWQNLILASVRLGCNFTYDHLRDLAEDHRTRLQMMQVGDWRRICDKAQW